jgi:pimeloyl-ACP methyl ester carboxylesterase
MVCKRVALNTPIPLFYTGQDLYPDPEKDLPCVIYLGLSAKESLCIDPFNQPVALLEKHSIRVFSVDLPFHGDDMPSIDGMKRWADHFLEGEYNLITTFLDDLEASLKLLFNHIKPSKIAIMGLSRGGFLASHIAARMPEIHILLAFAPLTQIAKCKEFFSLEDHPFVQDISIESLTPKLYSKTIRSYIGNRDVRVGTSRCYSWTQSLVEEAFAHKIRSPKIELILRPSIGFQGHGTSKETFEEGALWIKEQLELNT